ncbi:flagellar FliJ protein [Thermosyntropha lipolytica DSM 11003]|uniref:Flagellar FliJ protein n=1 Tax=Thermosyntropha lipolytica DSM 11003 TaxID=1123382 RepID=A0A1M5L007_9FIRM|nr:flagellar export protein FliJ [Thermosyntropha lipolytica]SHG58295.1 flagellar FliJ protein [Thermosyntropha lipolytica DSM 11003]
MKPFVFRLQTKLDVSRREEEMAKARLQAKEKEVEELEVEKANLYCSLARSEAMMRNFLRESNIYFVNLIRDYIPVLKENIARVEERLDKAREELENLRQDLLKKKREVKTLEKLKQKAWEEYLYELNREEQKFIDEIATSRYWQRQKKIDE